MDYPIPVEHRKPLFWLTLVPTLIVGWMLRGPLSTEESPHGIIDLELAGSVDRAKSIIAAWDTAGVRHHAVANVRLDFLWIGLYSTTLSLGCIRAAGVLRHHRWRRSIVDLGVVVAWLQWGAGGLDLVENIALMRMLRGRVAKPWPAIARWCALPKFVLVLAGFAYTLLGAAMLMLHWIRR